MKERWEETGAVQCPSIDMTVRGACIDEDVLVTSDEDTPRIGETGENDYCWSGICIILPNDNLTVVTPWHDDGVRRRDEKGDRLGSDNAWVRKNDGIRIPRSIWTEVRLIKRSN